MAAEASRAPRLRERITVADRIRQFIAKVEPWYDWGSDAAIWRMDAVERDFSDESEGTAWYFELQWLGVHFEVRIGRTPAKVPAEEVAARKAIIATREAA